jgi:hypothetical protein
LRRQRRALEHALFHVGTILFEMCLRLPWGKRRRERALKSERESSEFARVELFAARTVIEPGRGGCGQR